MVAVCAFILTFLLVAHLEAIHGLTITSTTNRFLDMPSASPGDKAYFKVTCNGPCQNIRFHEYHSSAWRGDPDLYAEEYSRPTRSQCTLCRSEGGSRRYDSCNGRHGNGINTGGNAFYVMVYAASAYQGVELTFMGNNLLKVELIEDDIRIPYDYDFGQKYFKVSCSGPCQNIGFQETHLDGDPDLCANEHFLPTAINRSQCTLCRSEGGSHRTDSCSGINTESNGFYVMIQANSDYGHYQGVKLSFTGNNNILYVKQVCGAGYIPHSEGTSASSSGSLGSTFKSCRMVDT